MPVLLFAQNAQTDFARNLVNRALMIECKTVLDHLRLIKNASKIRELVDQFLF